jgi:beta-lactamase superfamily II metal-dependent hydrolase
VSFLLPSDVTAPREGSWPRASRRQRSSWRAVAAAADATSAAWLAAVQPSAVVISVAPDPRTVRPDPQLLARLQAAGLAVWRTDVEGQASSSATAPGFGS